MNSSDYQSWMRKAFLYVEAALGQELATPSRVCMTEDYFRSALVRGLAASRPDLAHRIDTEVDARPWTTHQCIQCGTTDGQRRPMQHDVAVIPDSNDQGLLCEVKWLKSPNPKAIAGDIWKLLLSRGIDAEQQARRTYLLLGGEMKALSDSLNSLRKHHVDFRWSNAGRNGGTPATRKLSAAKFLASNLGTNEFKQVLGWSSNPRHFRISSNMWAEMKISRRYEPWVKAIDGTKWRAVMFELHHFGVTADTVLDTRDFLAGLLFHCQRPERLPARREL
jgi:hypothetical protein